MVVDPITGTQLLVNLSLLLVQIQRQWKRTQPRNGDPLTANVLFTIDNDASGFTLSDGVVQADGNWSATIALSSGFAAGTHIAQAQYIPSVNYYSGSSANQSFDSRGYTVLTFIRPTLDGVNLPSLNDRTDRGDDLNTRLLLIDNTGAAVSGVQVSVIINGTSVSAVGPTDVSGIVDLNLTVPFDAPVGFHDLNAEFVGTPTTGWLEITQV